MRRFLLLGLALTAGCLGPRQDHSAFFLLSSLPVVAEGSPVAVVLGLGPIMLPGYLDRPQIVIRLSENEIALTASDRWAEPLRDNMSRALKENLSKLLTTNSFVDYPWYESAAPDYGIAVEVRRFEADPSGNVVLDAIWHLTQSGTVIDTQTSVIVDSAGGPERTATVAAQSRAWAELSREIAAAIRRAQG